MGPESKYESMPAAHKLFASTDTDVHPPPPSKISIDIHAHPDPVPVWFAAQRVGLQSHRHYSSCLLLYASTLGPLAHDDTTPFSLRLPICQISIDPKTVVHHSITPSETEIMADNRRLLQRNLAQDDDGSDSSIDSENSRDSSVSPHPRRQDSCTSLQPVPSSPAAAANNNSPTSIASTDLAHERQTLLLMLLGQVCSLHDATPRTFVVHVIALYERGILDSNSIQFLFDLGLVPRGYDLNQIGAEMNAGRGDNGDDDEGGGEEDHASCGNNNFSCPSCNNSFSGANFATATSATKASSRKGQENETISSSKRDAGGSQLDNNQGAIVPYCAEAAKHPWTRYLPPPPFPSNNSSSNKMETNQHSNNLHSKKMEHRKREASAIREHLERHESLDDSSARGSIFGSVDAMQQGLTSVTTSSSTSPPNSNNRWNRANSSATQNTLTSAEESFDNPSFRPHLQHHDAKLPNNEMPNTSAQVMSHMPPTASWSVEHHPLSLSRYQREFHQISLLATGSFGSVYHAIHKLEQKPYAVKCVTFSTVGYYANTLALVIREVRCLAQLDHPNCVRYHTSWLEPSWMTGDQKESFASDDDGDNDEQDGDDDDEELVAQPHGKGSPKLLTDIERVIEGLHNTEEIDTSVEQLEAILYGDDDGGDMDDGFNWASSSQTSHSAFSFDRTEQEDAMDDEWGNLPSHRTTNNSGDGDDSDSDESDGAQGVNNSSGSNIERESFHNVHLYERQGSLELIPAGQAKNHRRQYKKQNSSSSASVSYKYQISLYIQMQLCHPTTLADWIKLRNGNCVHFDAEERQARARPAFEIFRQVVNGLAHVHAKGIIHRDLKPANIFASDDGSFMIGDFGLSKMMRDANTRGVDIDAIQSNAIILPSGFSNDIHTSGVGTASYASPEQIATKTYGTAADIFSLGLILLEFFSNFTSEHERAKAFHDCRHNRELAPWMKRYYPEVSALIMACTQTDWMRRPSASDIQAAGVFQERGSGAEILRAESRALKVEMARKDKLIQSQKLQLKEKDEMIENLRRRLAELGTSGVGVLSETGKDPVDIEDSSSDDDY